MYFILHKIFIKANFLNLSNACMFTLMSSLTLFYSTLSLCVITVDQWERETMSRNVYCVTLVCVHVQNSVNGQKL